MATATCSFPMTAMRPADPEADAAWMLRLRDGDVAAFDLLMRKHQRAIHGYIYRMVQNACVAEELTQEVFLRMYLARANYQPAARFTTWLYQIATNLTLNWVRDHRREREAASVEQSSSPVIIRALSVKANPENLLLREETLRRVRESIAGLPDRQRAVVLLHKYGELDYKQIAQTLDTSVSAVKSLANRAFAALREQFSAEGIGLAGCDS